MRRISGLVLLCLLTGVGTSAAQYSPNSEPDPVLPQPRITEPAPAAPSAPILPGLVSLPAPAPAVVDPRSGAWRQHRGLLVEHECSAAEDSVTIGAGRKRGVLEIVYRFFHPYCPGCR
jgi:hypothetical protein